MRTDTAQGWARSITCFISCSSLDRFYFRTEETNPEKPSTLYKICLQGGRPGIQIPSPQFQAQNVAKYPAEMGFGTPSYCGRQGARPPTTEASKGTSVGGGAQLFPRGVRAVVCWVERISLAYLRRCLETPAAEELRLIPMKDGFGSRKIFPTV